MLTVERAAERQIESWLDPEYRARMLAARATRAAEDAMWKEACAKLCKEKVASRLHPGVSLARVRFLDDQYQAQRAGVLWQSAPTDKPFVPIKGRGRPVGYMGPRAKKVSE